MKTIVLEKRPYDFFAALAGVKGAWGCGPSTKAAIGDLILAHPQMFGIKIKAVQEEKQARKAGAR